MSLNQIDLLNRLLDSRDAAQAEYRRAEKSREENRGLLGK